ncbi:DEAD/DEAH box helicase [Methanogenium cariaci]|uniref:DEAD/DEAH box helicase n=1 Tax=Methanogenium cariaci TaxID=2197 RepID=UPI000780ABF0|nr:DEAD/DEAH box helicase [Methanogenium cariaci]
MVSPYFHDLNQKQLPVNRPLYLHQEQALKKTIVDGQNIVVATGTGSGKTEIFMLTILNELFRQKEAGTLNSGVRALLLYPMNALVNDQLKRMRLLLATTPDITFGRYTGETPEKRKQAVEQHRNLHGCDPLVNERVCREEMRQSPPHILLTNYAMLEYLLLRPSDNVFFDGNHANSWKFIVLDEAHTYNGAKGIEMAMLLRL